MIRCRALALDSSNLKLYMTYSNKSALSFYFKFLLDVGLTLE